jgi:primosomal protein N' (replication factor Y)
VARTLRRLAPEANGVEVLGPAPAPLTVMRGRYRWRLLVRAKRTVNLQAFMQTWLRAARPKGSLRIDIDIDPYSFL